MRDLRVRVRLKKGRVRLKTGHVAPVTHSQRTALGKLLTTGVLDGDSATSERGLRATALRSG